MIKINIISVFLFFLFFCAFVECQNCFIRHQNIGIVNGEPADIREIPYQIAIWYRWPGFLPYILQKHYFNCGGVIIGQKWILTAAHCVDEGYDYYIRAGSSYSNEGGKCFEIKNITLHPDFNGNYADSANDIAIMELQENIIYDETMHAIDFPDENFKLRVTQMVKISGNGYSDVLGPNTIQLMKFTPNVISKDVCEESYVYMPKDVFCILDRKHKSTSKLKIFPFFHRFHSAIQKICIHFFGNIVVSVILNKSFQRINSKKSCAQKVDICRSESQFSSIFLSFIKIGRSFSYLMLFVLQFLLRLR